MFARKLEICLCLVCLTIAGAARAQMTSDPSATGMSRAFNPAISVNGLFYAMASSRDNPLYDEAGIAPGLHLQEMSVEMTSNVDVYLKAKAVLAATEDEGVYVEEIYVTTIQMPIPVIVKGGRMLNTFGRHNLYHLHHMAFAEPPLVLTNIFGPDLNEKSVEASYLVPVPWYMDVTAGVLNGDNPYLFDGDEQDDLAYLGHLDNMWGITDEITLRLGGSFLTGEKGLHFPDEDRTPLPEGIDEVVSEVYGADLHLKWRPLEHGRARSVTLQGEYVEARMLVDGDYTDPASGAFLQLLGQFETNYWLQARYGYYRRPEELHLVLPEPVKLDYDMGEEMYQDRWSFAFAYVPTEFSSYRVQYNVIRMADHYEYQVVSQVNFTIGSHPAHKY